MTRPEYSSDDLRVKRTHKLVLEALLDQTVQKGFAALSVSDITKYAGINRATFYRHYKDKFDLLDHYAQAVYELLDVPLEAGPQMSNKTDANQIFQRLIRILDHIRANAKFYRVMLGKTAIRHLQIKFGSISRNGYGVPCRRDFKMTRCQLTCMSATVPAPL